MRRPTRHGTVEFLGTEDLTGSVWRIVTERHDDHTLPGRPERSRAYRAPNPAARWAACGPHAQARPDPARGRCRDAGRDHGPEPRRGRLDRLPDQAPLRGG